MRGQEPPLKSRDTPLIAAALVSAAKLAGDKPFLHTIEEADDEPKRTTTWSMDGGSELVFRPNFSEETLDFAEFCRRFEDDAWCRDNPDHPIAYLRAYAGTLANLREQLRGQKPALLLRKGKRFAVIPQNADPERKVKSSNCSAESRPPFRSMAEDIRTRQLEAAFADPAEGETMIGGLHLRPFSLGTLNVCRQLGLTLFLDGEAELSDEEKQRQIVAFAWAQSAPLSEMLAALRTGTASEKIAEFEFQMDVAALPELISEIQRFSELAAAAAVEVSPKPGRSGEDDAPQNC